MNMRNKPFVGAATLGRTLASHVALFAFCLALIGSQICHADQPLSSSATVNLQAAVAKMNKWLRGSANEAGWRKYLHLNQLDAETALGEYAQAATLQRVLDRFSGDVKGLDAPEFNDVRIALAQQVALLSENHSIDLNWAVKEAIAKYRRVSISDLEAARSLAAYELRLLKKRYRKTMDSRPRSELFYELKLDEQIEYLDGLEFELPPEISAGKTRSMIRDEQRKLKAIEEKIDAMPLEDEDEDEYDDEDDTTETSIDKADPDESDDNSILLPPVLSPPGPDDGKDTLKDLEKQASVIEQRIDELKQMYRDLKAADADRVAKRTGVLNQLADFNARYDKVAEDHSDPWFVSTALAAERFNFLYFYATDDNLQEEFLERIGDLATLLEESPDLSNRKAHGEAGKLLQWLESAGQVPQLVAAIRSQHSQPNLYASFSAGMINALVSENSSSLNQRQRVKEVFFGRIVRGTAQINGDVSVTLNPDPHQINLAIRLLGSITSQTYSRERKWCINASAAGSFHGHRQFFGSRRGVDASDVESDASVSSSYGGISSNLNLVKRKAAETFQQQKPRNDAESTRRIKGQVTDGFIERTDEALEIAQDGVAQLGDRLEEFARFVPPLFVRTLHDRIELVARKANQGSLASPSAPANYGRQDEISATIHETMLTNYLDPVFAGKTFTNEELRTEAQNRFGVDLPEPKAEKEDKEEPQDFSITFDRVRPVQLEFKDNQLAVIVTGRRFAQEARSIRAGLRFRLTFRIVSKDGALKLIRVGDTVIEYTNPEKKDAKLVAFRSFLEKRLNETTEVDDEVELPANLIPDSLVDGRPMAKSLILNTLRMDEGWLYLGWNRSYGYGSDLAAIWDEGTLASPVMPVDLEQPTSPSADEPPMPAIVAWEDDAMPASSIAETVPYETKGVILSGADGSISPGQMIKGEIVHEVFVDGIVSEVPVVAPRVAPR